MNHKSSIACCRSYMEHCKEPGLAWMRGKKKFYCASRETTTHAVWVLLSHDQCCTEEKRERVEIKVVTESETSNDII
jgi:hypothetical protein